MNLKLIACKVLQRELSLLSAKSRNFIDITYIRQGFHDEPEKLHKLLQDEIDAVDSHTDIHSCADKAFDAICLGYGLCSNAIADISSKKHPLVIPRAHDCIALLLGSKESYKEYFEKHSGGIYWYSAGWIENTLMPSEERYARIYHEYKEKYGEDNAGYLIEMEQGWMTQYNRCTYINWKSLEFPDYIAYAKECARYLKWDFDMLTGSPSLLSDMLDGNWDNQRFIVVPPGQKPEPSNDDAVFK